MATYKVQKGDTLWKIAQQNKTTVANLAKANNIANPDMINIGQSITIPDAVKADTVVADYQANLDTYKDKQDTYSAATKNVVANTPPATVNTTAKKAATVNPPMPVATTAKEAQAEEAQETPSVTDTDPYYQAVENFLSEAQASQGTAQTSQTATQETAQPVFTYPYKEEIDALIQQVLDRPKFSYDIGNDPSYNALKDQYTSLGNLAMRDATGNAAGLTGGYGNTYAAGVGNQAYQQYLGKLNEQVPELYQNALDNYITEGNEIYKQIDSLNDANYYAQREYSTNYDTQSAERSYQDAKSQQEYENALALLDNVGTEDTTSEAVSYKDVNTMIVNAYDKGMSNDYIAMMVYNMYKDQDSFWEEGGLIDSLLLPDGSSLAELIYKILEGNTASNQTAESGNISSYIKDKNIESIK